MTLQEDRTTLQSSDLSPHSYTAIRLRLAEKEILEYAQGAGRTKRLHFQKLLDDGAPLPVYEENDAKPPVVLRHLEEEQEDEQLKMPLVNGVRKEKEREAREEKAESDRQRTENTPTDPK